MTFKDALDQVKEKGMQSLLLRVELEAELDSDRMWLIGPVTECSCLSSKMLFAYYF